MTANESLVIVVLVTAANREEAAHVAEMLVNKRLAACVQILPEMQSIYHWKGQIQRESEVLLLAKTIRGRFLDLEREVRAVHSYETPEIIAVEITDASKPYLDWLMGNVDLST